jgi:hypothetical protein
MTQAAAIDSYEPETGLSGVFRLRVLDTGGTARRFEIAILMSNVFAQPKIAWHSFAH